MSDSWDSLSNIPEDLWTGIKSAAGGAEKGLGLGPPDLSGLNAASADAKALEAQFLSQMGQSQGVPTLVAPGGSTPEGGSIWGGQGQPAPAATQFPTSATDPGLAHSPGGNPVATGGPAHLPPGAALGGGLSSGTGSAPAPGGLSTATGGAIAPSAGAGQAMQSSTAHTTAGSNFRGTLATNVSPTAQPWRSGTTPAGASVPTQAQLDAQRQQFISRGPVVGSSVGPTPGTNPYATAAAGGGPTAAAPTGVAANPTAPGMDTSQEAQFRAGQVGLAQHLADVINGKTPSVAQMQMQQAFQQQQAQQLGMAAAMGRGGNQALAMRSAMNNTGNLGAQQAAASAIQRAQESATATGQMGSVLNEGRGGDVNIANANQQSQISTRGQNISQAQNQAQNVLQANANQQSAYGTAFNAAAANRQANANLLSAGAGAASMLSDKRAKTGIKEEPSDDLQSFLEQIKPVSYRYKTSPKDSKVGVIAQDVERSKVGKTMVHSTPAGKAIDIPAATGAMLAALADVHKRVSNLERGGGGPVTATRQAA